MKKMIRIIIVICMSLQQVMAAPVATAPYVPITIEWERDGAIKFYIPRSFNHRQFQKGEAYFLRSEDRYFQAINAGEDKQGNTLWTDFTEIYPDLEDPVYEQVTPVNPSPTASSFGNGGYFDSAEHRGAVGSAIQTGLAHAIYNGLVYSQEYKQEIQEIYTEIAKNQEQTQANYVAVQAVAAQTQEGLEKTISSFKESLSRTSLKSVTTIQYQSQDAPLVASLKELEVVLKSITTTEPVRQQSQQWGLKMLQESDSASVAGDHESARAFKQFAESFADLALGLDPITGPIRDLYEAFTGKNLVTGEELDTMERTFAVLGAVTFGFGSKIAKGLNVISSMASVEHFGESISKAAKIAEHSRNVVRPANSAMAHSLYLKELRSGMARPEFQDAELKKFMKWFWRPDGRTGNGSTAAAIRYERLTGLLTEGKSHLDKGKHGIVKLNRWLKSNPNASASDRRAVENIIQDVMDALEGEL